MRCGRAVAMALPFGKGATDRAGVLDLENRAEEGVENHTAEGGKRRDNDDRCTIVMKNVLNEKAK